MRIVIAGQAYFRQDNGQASFTVRLATGLARAGHKVLAIAPAPDGRVHRFIRDGVRVMTLPTIPLPYNANITLPSRWLIGQSMADFDPDIVHVQDHYWVSRAVWREAEKREVPVVGTNHFLPENLMANFLIPDFLRPPVGRVMWRYMLKFFNQLVAATTPTQTAVNILKTQEINIGLRAISCGVDTRRFHPLAHLDRPAVREKWGLDPHKTVFLYVGRIDHEKNLDQLIEAAGLLKRTDIQFAIAGKGSHRNTLERQAADLGLSSTQIDFLGFVPDEQLPALLNAADYFVMPSTAELQSIATMEAMASGLPVLAANARALPELVHHQVNGYLFQPDDAAEIAAGITFLADHPERWSDMSAASLNLVEKHDYRTTINQYANWYRSCAAQQPSKRRILA